MPLSDRFRAALVTGASTGLGEAITTMLLREGVPVWGTSRDRSRLKSRESFHALSLELAQPAAIDAAWAAAENESGGIDLLVNNAGAARFGPMDEETPASWEEQLNVLLHGPVRLARLAWSTMHARGRGTIVNVTSLAVELPIPYMAAYNAAKAALATFTASLACERAASANHVALLDFRPGDYATPFHRTMEARRGGAALAGEAARVWRRLEAIQRGAPPADRAARDLGRALARRRTGVVRSGGFFQARVAPWGNRLLPAPVMRWLCHWYFRSGT